MKNILLLLIVVSLAFVSCDNRKSRSESLKISVAEFNKKQSEIEIISYYPTENLEIVTDTIISNEVKIHIKNYTLSNERILISQNDKSSTKNKKYHRVFESDIVVSTPKKEILSTHVSAELFKSLYTDAFWNSATLEHVWVNQELSTIENIKLDMSFINPIDNSYKLYRMSIDSNGKQKIDFIEERT